MGGRKATTNTPIFHLHDSSCHQLQQRGGRSPFIFSTAQWNLIIFFKKIIRHSTLMMTHLPKQKNLSFGGHCHSMWYVEICRKIEFSLYFILSPSYPKKKSRGCFGVLWSKTPTRTRVCVCMSAFSCGKYSTGCPPKRYAVFSK